MMSFLPEGSHPPRMWAYATLALKDDPLFRRLLDASIARIEDHDTQNLANTSRGRGGFLGGPGKKMRLTDKLGANQETWQNMRV